MKKLKQLLFACVVFLSSISLGAQDIHFSQFYMSPLNLNPALTGVMNCNIRLVGNYRNQWGSVLKSFAFNTYSVSYDQRVPVGRSDFFGIGGTFWGDRAGQSRFSTLQGKLSFSYSKKMGGYRSKKHYLVIGGEAGVSQRSIDFLALQWGSQHDNDGGFDEGLPSNEDGFTLNNFLFADLAAGILWFTILDDDNNFFVGGAFNHLNRANQSFNRENFEALYSRFTLHAGGEFTVGDRVAVLPGVITMFQGKSFELNTGASLKFLLGKSRRLNQAFQIGAWMRLSNHWQKTFTGDAFILSTKFDYDQFSIGFSYDVNVSTLRPASNGNGAFEFALTYKICGPEKRNVYCPNF